MSYHELSKHAVKDAMFWAFCGLLFSLWAACGYPVPSRRLSRHLPGHDPFAFEDYTVLDALGVAAGLVVLAIWGPRLIARYRLWRDLERTQDARFFARAGMARTIYELLLGVAATDGRIDSDERAAVARVMTKELPETVVAQDMKSWSTTVEPPHDPIAIAKSLMPLLTPAERACVFEWCKAVAKVDGTDDDESDVLHRLRVVLAPPDFAAGLRSRRSS